MLRHDSSLVRDPRFNPTNHALIMTADTGYISPVSMLKFLDPLITAWTEKRGNAKLGIGAADREHAEAG